MINKQNNAEPAKYIDWFI